MTKLEAKKVRILGEITLKTLWLWFDETKVPLEFTKN